MLLFLIDYRGGWPRINIRTCKAQSAGTIQQNRQQLSVYRNKGWDVGGTIRWHTLLKKHRDRRRSLQGWGGNPLSLLMLF